MPKRVIFTGSHGVGKTSLLESVAAKLIGVKSTTVIPEVARALAEEGYAVNDSMTEEGFVAYITRYLQSVTRARSDLILSDRSLLDLKVYTQSIASGRIRSQLRDLLTILLEQEFLSGAEYVYVPIEFPLAADGIRREDLEYQQHIDRTIKSVLEKAKVPILRVTGDLAERTTQVLTYYGS